MSEAKKNCPICDSEMDLRAIKKTTEFKGVNVDYATDLYVCDACEIETGDIKATGDIQRQIADSYRTATGLLSGREIKSLREGRGLSQNQLAEKMAVGIASIKRWEGGAIQSKAMDDHLRHHLQPGACCNDYTGNRDFSIPRVKLVIDCFEEKLGHQFLKKGEKLLYNGKYLWYADMISYRDLGRSMTGATYAALPFGPQLNNYRELIQSIREANTDKETPLVQEEISIIEGICKKFPHQKQVFDASHREVAWTARSAGETIPYSAAMGLTEI